MDDLDARDHALIAAHEAAIEQARAIFDDEVARHRLEIGKVRNRMRVRAHRRPKA